MTKIILPALLTMLALTGEASAQQRTFYDASGRAVVRSVTGSSGAVTNYGADGRVISRETTGGNSTTTIYDAGGRTVGSFTRGR
jgi:YD repeat-containing protein